jgi:hypothetical protein
LHDKSLESETDRDIKKKIVVEKEHNFKELAVGEFIALTNWSVP